MKKLFIVIGPESSCSMKVTQILAFVLGIHKKYNSTPVGFQTSKDEQLAIIHKSIPSGRPEIYYDVDYFKKKYPGYIYVFIFTTRYNVISSLSSSARFDKSIKKTEVLKRQTKIRFFFNHLLEKENFFIFSYETYLLLGDSYLKYFYKSLNIKSNFYPNDFIDVNKKWLKKGNFLKNRIKRIFFTKLGFLISDLILLVVTKNSRLYKFLKNIFLKIY